MNSNKRVVLIGLLLAALMAVAVVAHAEEASDPEPYLQALIPPDQIKPGDQERLKSACEADPKMVQDTDLIQSPYGPLRLFGCLPKSMKAPEGDQVSKAPANTKA